MAKYFEFFLNDDGSIRKFTKAEIDEIEIQTLGIRDGSHPTHSREVNQSTVECEYLINPAFFERFVAYMCGGQKTFLDVESDPAVRRLSRLMPQRWPGLSEFAAVKVGPATGHKFLEDNPDEEDLEELEDEDDPLLQVPQYDRMKVKVLFQHMPFDLFDDNEPDASVNETRRYMQVLPSGTGVDYLTLPGGVMKFIVEDGSAGPPSTPIPHLKAIPQNIGHPLVQSAISRKWLRLPPEAWGGGTTLYNRIHGDPEAEDPEPFLGTMNKVRFLGYAPGTLLLVGCDEEVVLDPIGYVKAWNLTYRWLYKPQGHCHFFFYPTKTTDSDKAGWYFVSNDETFYDYSSLPDGKSLFNVRDHYKLFRVGE